LNVQSKERLEIIIEFLPTKTTKIKANITLYAILKLARPVKTLNPFKIFLLLFFQYFQMIFIIFLLIFVKIQSK